MKTTFRLLPQVGPDNEHFWQGGREGELRFLRCQPCGHYVHPPSPLCPQCLSRKLEPEAVSGRAVVHTFTVNHQRWIPGFEPPYVVAIVELEEQEGLRLTTNLVHCEPDGVEIGMPVRVLFEELDENIFLPLFEPAEGADRPRATGATG